MKDLLEHYLSDDYVLDLIAKHELDCTCELCLVFVMASDHFAGIKAVRKMLLAGAQ